ncbi:hypothetical protein GN244_ATG11979 [Phytophthora infestans]|uniref:Uncharacterized protein n=1 Tax=Phytophthora infestans TaxID=4787 RepID=A0A833RZ90_PHYIN|nr:hypothetical protein GN244_ATG11979 [Phytophthora infestans]KAF4144636.1 hypothetical protein GN958_ATG06166 [Phytophthora infestans]
MSGGEGVKIAVDTVVMFGPFFAFFRPRFRIAILRQLRTSPGSGKKWGTDDAGPNTGASATGSATDAGSAAGDPTADNDAKAGEEGEVDPVAASPW